MRSFCPNASGDSTIYPQLLRNPITHTRWHILDALWLISWAFYGLLGVPHAPLHGDEPTQLYMSRDYYYQFVENDWHKVFYHEDADAVVPDGATQQQLRLLNGTLPKYAFGWATHQAGYTINDLTNQWDWALTWEQNQARNAVPQPDMLYTARLTSWVAWWLGILALFCLARTIANRRVAYIATLIFALNPVVLLHGQRLMMDSFMLTGMIATVWLGILAQRHRRWWLYVLLGITAGIALASKHTSAFALLGVFGALGALALHTLYQSRLYAPLIRLTGASIMAFLVFYTLNPAWWGAPIQRAQTVLTLRQELLAGQTATFAGYTTLTDQFNAWLWHSFGAVPMYYEVATWAQIPQVQAQISTYDGQWWAGIAPHGAGGLALALLTLFGLWYILRQRPTGTPIILAWALMMLCLTLIITPLEWQRYYLPMYPVVALYAALGVHTTLALIAPKYRTNP